MSRQLDQFIKVSIPEPYTILGVKLRPLSLGHLILMHRFQCAFEADGVNDITIWDLLLGICICSRKYNEFLEWYLDEERKNKWLEDWFKKMIKYMKSEKTFNILEKFSLFNMYRKESVLVPLYFEENEENGRESGAHWVQNILSTLVTEGSYGEEEILNMPLSKAIFLYFKVLENHGVITLMPDWQVEAIEKQEKESQCQNQM